MHFTPNRDFFSLSTLVSEGLGVCIDANDTFRCDTRRDFSSNDDEITVSSSLPSYRASLSGKTSPRRSTFRWAEYDACLGGCFACRDPQPFHAPGNTRYASSASRTTGSGSGAIRFNTSDTSRRVMYPTSSATTNWNVPVDSSTYRVRYRSTIHPRMTRNCRERTIECMYVIGTGTVSYVKDGARLAAPLPLTSSLTFAPNVFALACRSICRFIMNMEA